MQHWQATREVRRSARAGSGFAPTVKVRPAPTYRARSEVHRRGEGAAGHQPIDRRATQAGGLDYRGQPRKDARRVGIARGSCNGALHGRQAGVKPGRVGHRWHGKCDDFRPKIVATHEPSRSAEAVAIQLGRLTSRNAVQAPPSIAVPNFASECQTSQSACRNVAAHVTVVALDHGNAGSGDLSDCQQVQAVVHQVADDAVP
jgi:hypothetical protein